MKLALSDKTSVMDDPSPEQVAFTAEQVVARMQALGYTPSDVYKNSGPAPRVVVDLIEGHRWIKRADARRRLAFALRLQPDGIDRWARGDDAVPLDGPTPAEELTRLAEIQATQTEEIHGLRIQVEGIEHLLRSVLRAVEERRSRQRSDGSQPPDQPPS